MIDAGKAGINRARGYRRERCDNDTNAPEDMVADVSPSNIGLHRRRVNNANASVNQPPLQNSTNNCQPTSPITNDASIAGLLGLDDEYRIIGSHQNSEDEIRDVQLRGLMRRIVASPSLVLFPAKKEVMDVM